MLKNNSTATAAFKTNNPALLAAEWLLHSGIQNTSDDPRVHGGVNAWYDLKTKSYPFLYSEITGYAINALLFFHEILNDPIYLERARLAADWLIRFRDSKYGLVANRVYHETPNQPYYDSWIFTFDQWIIIYGFTNLFQITRDQVYLNAAEEIAKLLIRKTFRDDGSMYPIFNLETGQPEATNDKWSRQSGSFHAKALMALSSLYKLSGEENYLRHAAQLAKYALLNQQENGRFITQTNEWSTHLHPHLYSIEGLLSFGLFQNDRTLVKACEKGLEWILNSGEGDGSIYSFFKNDRFVPFERSDVLAQTLRMGAILLEHSDQIRQLNPKLKLVKEKLLSYQEKSGREAGGFLYGQEQDGTTHHHINAWITMFAAQALWLYDHLQTNGPKYDFRFFV